MSFESCQEIFTLTPYVPKGCITHALFNGHLHMYECINNIKFGVFNADKKECEFIDTEKYKTILAELTLRTGVNLIFGKENVPLTKDYKFHVASQVLTKVGSSLPAPRSNFPIYKSNNFHICETIINKTKNTKATVPIPAIGDFMCASPLLISKNTGLISSQSLKSKKNTISSKCTPLVLTLNYTEMHGGRKRFIFDNFYFIVCYGPYNQIMLCAIKKSSRRYTSYINTVERFDTEKYSLAVAINDEGIPSDYMETNVHKKHDLVTIEKKSGKVINVLEVK